MAPMTDSRDTATFVPPFAPASEARRVFNHGGYWVLLLFEVLFVISFGERLALDYVIYRRPNPWVYFDLAFLAFWIPVLAYMSWAMPFGVTIARGRASFWTLVGHRTFTDDDLRWVRFMVMPRRRRGPKEEQSGFLDLELPKGGHRRIGCNSDVGFALRDAFPAKWGLFQVPPDIVRAQAF